MKKTKLFKSLLLAAGMLVGSASAWADVVETTVVNCDFNNGETLFTGASRMDVSNDNNVKFTCAGNSQNGYSLATYDFSSAIGTDATAVKVAFDFWIPNQNAAYRRFFTVGQNNLRTGFGKTSYSTAGSMFAFGLARNSSANYFSINGASTTAAASASNVLGAWAHAEINIDHSAKTVSYKITSMDGATTYYTADNVAFVDASAAYCNQLDFFDCQNNVVSYLDNLVITKYVDQSKVATTYTVKYQNADGTDLKEAETYDTYAGDTYTASGNDIATFYSSDESKKYIYASGNESKVATETATDNVITLVFNEYDKIAYTVTAKDGDVTLAELASGDAYTDGSTTAYWSKYIQVDGKWYETTGSYGKAITEAGNTDVAFTASTITYFVEAENINKSRSAAAEVTGTQYSGGKAQRHYASSQWWTETFAEGGYYKVYFPYTMANKSASTLTIETRDADGTFTTTGLELTTDQNGSFSGFVTIPAGSSLAIAKGEYNSNILIDYVVLTKINSFSIVGDFSENGWDTTQGIEMTQSTEDPAIWTAVVENFEITSDKLYYEYKAVANGAYDVYVLPSGDNQNYNFGYDEAGVGFYNLTFTVNTTANTVELAIEKQKQSFTVSYVNTDNKATLYAYTFNAEELGGWPGTEMTKSTEQVNGFDVYTITFEAYNAPKNIIFNNNGDWKTGDLDFVNNSQYGIEWPKVNITIAGYATYCSPYALDFSEVEGLKAYVAKINGSNVTFEEVTTAPAKTGLLLKAAKGEYTVKPIATATATESALVGVLEDTKVSAGIFVLMDGEKGVGFYTTKNEFTVGANTAYIPALTTGDNARSFIALNFGDNTTTAIEGVATVTMESDAVFNLQGQRVNAAKKGLYIVNGKKMILK